MTPATEVKKGSSASGSLLELVLIVAVALGLALGIQAFLVKPYKIPSESMVPTLQIGQRVLVNRIGARFSDPDVGDVVVFHPPTGAEEDDMCGEQPPMGQVCLKATPHKADVNFIKRVVAGPGDRLAIRNGHVILNGKRQKEPFIRPCARRGGGVRLPARGHDSGRYLLHDGRQSWVVGRQPVLGTGPSQVDRRRCLRDLLASQAHRAPLRL